MAWYNHNIKCLDSNQNRWKLIAIVGVFAFVFVHFFEPFEFYSDQYRSSTEIFLELTLSLLVAILILIFMQFGLRPLFKVKSFTLIGLIGWFSLEALIIGTAWFLMSYFFNSQIDPWPIVWGTNILAYLILMPLPYFGAVFLLNYWQKSDNYDSLLEIINQEKVSAESRVVFVDHAGNQLITLQLGNILFLQSSDNYVAITYLEEGQNQKFLIRNTIKNLETQLQAFHIIRCHRSFMVNPLNVVSKKKSATGYDLKVKGVNGIQIPVSKTYCSEIDKALTTEIRVQSSDKSI